jgi:hypothetical protein
VSISTLCSSAVFYDCENTLNGLQDIRLVSPCYKRAQSHVTGRPKEKSRASSQMALCAFSAAWSVVLAGGWVENIFFNHSILKSLCTT